MGETGAYYLLHVVGEEVPPYEEWLPSAVLGRCEQRFVSALWLPAPDRRQGTRLLRPTAPFDMVRNPVCKNGSRSGDLTKGLGDVA